ncbi:hypothetical protein, partial [Lactiplantibacillus plantarum]|uniref:hypothetical protein n=1 Tax=Lactiplantibacillus plantarum TaxID=1590 RepID=UPI002181FF5C
QLLKDGFVVNTILKEADLFCPNSVRINFTIYLTLIYFGPTHSLLHVVVIVDHFHRYQTPLSAGSPVVAGGPFIDPNSNQIKITFCGMLNSHQRLSCQQLST